MVGDGKARKAELDGALAHGRHGGVRGGVEGKAAMRVQIDEHVYPPYNLKIRTVYHKCARKAIIFLQNAVHGAESLEMRSKMW